MEVPSILIEGIKFSHLGPQAEVAAIAVFISPSPEWPLQKRSAVAYPFEKVKPQERIDCCFKANDQGLLYKWVEIRAILMENDTAEVIAQSQLQFTENGFSSAGDYTGYVPFWIHTDLLLRPKVGAYPSNWRWEWRHLEMTPPTGAWNVFHTTHHVLFATLDSSMWPWGSDLGQSQAGLLWPAPTVDLITLACTWAEGATDKLAVATAITTLLASGTYLRYSLQPYYTSYPLDASTMIRKHDLDHRLVVHAEAFLERVSGMPGKGPLANCVDFAHLLMLLANALGCDLKIGRLQNLLSPAAGFNLNPIVPTGFPLQPMGHFAYHEVAWYGDAFDENALVFDPCLSFPDIEEQPVVIAGMKLKEYIAHLSQNPSDCQPIPYYPERILIR